MENTNNLSIDELYTDPSPVIIDDKQIIDFKDIIGYGAVRPDILINLIRNNCIDIYREAIIYTRIFFYIKLQNENIYYKDYDKKNKLIMKAFHVKCIKLLENLNEENENINLNFSNLNNYKFSKVIKNDIQFKNKKVVKFKKIIKNQNKKTAEQLINCIHYSKFLLDTLYANE